MDPETRCMKAFDHEETDHTPIFENLIQLPSLGHSNAMSLPLSPYQIEYILDHFNVSPFLPRINDISRIFLQNPKIHHNLVRFFAPDAYSMQIKFKIDMASAPYTMLSHFTISQTKDQGLVVIDEFGKKYKIRNLNGMLFTIYFDGAFKNPEDYEHYPKPDPLHPFGKEAFHAIKSKWNKKLFLIPGVYTGLFDSTWMAFGFKTFSTLLLKKPTFIERVIHDREIYIGTIMRNALDDGADFFFIGDDLAYNSGPFISPRHFQRFFVPNYKRLVNIAHRRGKRVIFHSDGNLNPIFSDLLEIGFDGIHPWQSHAQMDIFAGKKQYGDKISLLGNVPIELLSHGSPIDVKTYVSKLLDNCSQGG